MAHQASKSKANTPIHHPAAAGQTRFPAIPALYLGRMDTLGFAEGPPQPLQLLPPEIDGVRSGASTCFTRELVILQRQLGTNQDLRAQRAEPLRWCRRASRRSTGAGLTRFPAIPALYSGRMDTLGFAEGPHQLFRSS